MSKINRIRIINLNYNHNSTCIDDEIFDLSGENTLMHLKNGGGKSVLVQMIISTFVNKSYRDFPDRPFSGYFTTSKPTIIMVEWKLDYDNGYFMNGMMVRKNQNIEDDNPLEIVSFTADYKEANKFTIENLPIIEEKGKNKFLIGFGKIKAEFEKIKRNNPGSFSYFDMNVQSQRKSYFSTLLQNQIDHKEWENIIRKINLTESGLSTLFNDARDEKTLVEKWLLDIIEKKLNRNNNRIKRFEELSLKLIEQYRKNESSIKRKEVINRYFEDIIPIEKQIDEYNAIFEQREATKNDIALFNREVRQQIGQISERIDSAKTTILELTEKICEIKREKYSYDIYVNKDIYEENYIKRIDIEKDILSLTSEIKKYEKEINLIECRHLYDEMLDFEKELISESEKEKIILENEEKSKDELKLLAEKLFVFFTEDAEKLEENIEKQNEQENEFKKNKETLVNDKKNKEKEKGEYYKKSGVLEHSIEEFSKTEEKYNKRFKTEFTRNILGEYESGFLDIELKRLGDSLNKTKITINKHSEELINLDKRKAELSDEKMDLSILINRINDEIEKSNNRLSDLEQEKIERLNIMAYLELDEDNIDDVELILSRLKDKISKYELSISELRVKERAIEKAIEDLKQGHVLELSDKLKNMLEENGIDLVYGMEWLKKNDKSFDDNQKLVEANPFLPYSLIMSGRDLEALKNIKDLQYTSFPIPIIKREELNMLNFDRNNCTVDVQGISFYVMFNSHLLDENELKRIINDYGKELEKLQENIERQNEAKEVYQNRKMIIENQSFSIELIDQINDKLSEEKKLLSETEEKKRENSRVTFDTNERYERLDRELENLREEHRNYEFQREELIILINSYKEYQFNVEEKNILLKKVKELEETIKLTEASVEEIDRKISQIKYDIHNNQLILSQKQGKCAHFKALGGNGSKEKVGLIKEMDAAALETRYEAISNGIGRELVEIQQNIEQWKKRYEEKKKELIAKNIYNFDDTRINSVAYSEEKLIELSEITKKLERRLNYADNEKVQYEKEMSAISERIKHLEREMKREIGSDILVDKRNISDTNFDGRIGITAKDKENLEGDIKKLSDRKNMFDNAEMSMSEYSSFEIKNEPDTKRFKFENISKAEIIEIQGGLKRDYYLQNTNIEKYIRNTDKGINKIKEKDIYDTEYFKKCFDNLLGLVENVKALKEQCDINRRAFDTLLKKLNSDLESIDRDRKNIEEFFIEYVKDINQNLTVIDKNSSIKIRDKYVKMVKIVIPEWDVNAELYKHRVKEFVERFITRGMEVIEDNKNISEMLGNVITTRNLFDSVVGTGNVQIKMYKIEAEREVAITWKDVAANSGGEGFVSAFAILSCLLSYMRSDENDIFSSGREGKVLIMDNPFAQTNAEHLLKPLIEMAKHTNTQLICLSGLGGSSIYNRFDNIYVMNAVPSGINRDREYVRAEHTKGNDIKTLSLGQFKTEQMSLFDLF